MTVTNEDTNITSKAATGATGDYVASNLPPGSYTVTTEIAGFKKTTVKSVRLLANRTVRVDLVLEPGAITQTVDVTAPAPVVNSENATVGSIMEAPTIAALPLNGRTIDRLLSLAAGTVDTGGGRAAIRGAARRSGVQFNVDGVNFNDEETDRRTMRIRPEPPHRLSSLDASVSSRSTRTTKRPSLKPRLR